MDPKRLREETRREHEATEDLLPLGQAGLTQDGYRAGLRALQPIVASWERWAEQWGPGELRDLLRARRRSPLLEADLAFLGEPAAGSLAGVDWWAVVGDPGGARVPEAEMPFRARFLGAVYVMEGSTLGGRFLARHVTAELGEAFVPATQYFAGHGERTGSMWREVLREIETIPEELAEEAVTAARRAFRAFGEALRAGQGEVVTQSGETQKLTQSSGDAS